MHKDNHCTYCQTSVSGPFHAGGWDSIYQAEIDELKQENVDLRAQLERTRQALDSAIHAIRNPFTVADPTRLADKLEEDIQ